MQADASEGEPGTVCLVLQKGYQLGDVCAAPRHGKGCGGGVKGSAQRLPFSRKKQHPLLHIKSDY